MDIKTIVDEAGSSLDLGKVHYLFIFADAAAEGMHGRRASSHENVAVSQFYVRTKHELRRRYGYARAVTAIHATQVYHLVDKTFREAADIDVIKALPKSGADRKTIARLMAPEYVPAVFSLLRRLGRQHLLARTLAELLEAVYTAVVAMDGIPYVVRAFHDRSRIAEETTEKKRWLRKVQHMALGPEEESGPQTQTRKRESEDNRALGNTALQPKRLRDKPYIYAYQLRTGKRTPSQELLLKALETMSAKDLLEPARLLAEYHGPRGLAGPVV